MARVTTKLTTALAGLALASLPAMAGAQSTTPQQPRPGTSQQQPQPQSRSQDQNSPQHHLDHAKKILNNINPSSVQGEARTQITELKRNFNQLENAWRNKSGHSARSDSAHATGHTSGTTGTSGTSGSTTSEQTGTTSGTASQTPRSDRASSMAGNDDWMRHYQAIDSTLDRLIGDTSASMSGTAGTSGTTGTTGSTGASASASVKIDASLRSQLTEFRRHLDLFHAAAMSQNQRMGEEDRASADPHSGVTGSMTGTAGTSGTTSSGTMTSGTSGQTTSGTSGQTTTGAQTRTSASASGQVDSAAIARLTASIDELLRGTSEAGTAGTSGSTSSTTGTTSTGTAGTTGTSSSAQATVCVDRAKLEQLKRDIQALNRNNQQ